MVQEEYNITEWVKDGELLPSASDSDVLAISSLQPSDLGEYKCRMRSYENEKLVYESMPIILVQRGDHVDLNGLNNITASNLPEENDPESQDLTDTTLTDTTTEEMITTLTTTSEVVSTTTINSVTFSSNVTQIDDEDDDQITNSTTTTINEIQKNQEDESIDIEPVALPLLIVDGQMTTVNNKTGLLVNNVNTRQFSRSRLPIENKEILVDADDFMKNDEESQQG